MSLFGDEEKPRIKVFAHQLLLATGITRARVCPAYQRVLM